MIEDACQFAWSRLLLHRERVNRETALSWLAATAVHEALKLVRRTERDLSLETVLEQGAEVSSLSPDRAPHARAEHRERLGSLASLPQRQQQAMWLYGLGLSYEEIARRQGSTSRGIERQLHRARATLRNRETTTSRAGSTVDLGG